MSSPSESTPQSSPFIKDQQGLQGHRDTQLNESGTDQRPNVSKTTCDLHQGTAGLDEACLFAVNSLRI
ncbi:hypothetical protein CRUP_006961 [Coryphaenoides rupestris]|nr:hypothetical protein CRUP_006961 [Coryphaenoides rupestris]